MNESYNLDLSLGNGGWLTVAEGPDLPDCDYVFVTVYGPSGGNRGTILLTPDEADSFVAFLEAKVARLRAREEKR